MSDHIECMYYTNGDYICVEHLNEYMNKDL
jgi:hypothetical protein